jgi:SAM-dependent methyltransferase
MKNKWDEIYNKKKYSYYDLEKPYSGISNVISILKKRKCRNVLDLGCGSGRNLVPLAKSGFNVYGLDYSEKGISSARILLMKKSLGAKLSVADAFSRLPYPGSFFDAVISIQVLSHSGEKGILHSVSEINRILKPGGLLFVTVPGRISNNKVRECLVRTAKKIAPNTYVPTKGSEAGLVHFIYNKKLILLHYSLFRIKKIWKDEKNYFCVLGEKK